MDNITIVNQDYQFVCEDISDPEGFEFPTTRNVFINPPNQPGSLYINSLAGERIVAFRGLIKENIQQNRRNLAAVCQPGNLKTFKFTTCDGVALQFEAEINKLINPYRVWRSPYLIEATAPDPYFYSQTLHSASSAITTVNGGTPVPAAIPAPIGGGSSLSFIIHNAGNAVSKPIFTIRGPGTNFLIQNVSTGVKFNLNLTLLENETVVINTATDRALKGSQRVYGSVIRDPATLWPVLRPGDNSFVFRAQSGSNANTRLTVDWRDAYIGS
jgi:hypothetical protein